MNDLHFLDAKMNGRNLSLHFRIITAIILRYQKFSDYYGTSHCCLQVTTDLDGACTENFEGTSSAAPLASGCIALALQAK